MNKKITLLTIMAVAALFMTVTSCKKASNNVDQLATLGKATITGRVFAKLVDTSSAIQYAPSGTTISAWVNTHDFIVNPDGTASYAKKYYTATVQSDGSYTLSVDVSQYQSATIHIEPAQFTYNEVTFSGTQRKIYNAAPVNVTVTNGITSIQDLMYN